MKKIYFIKLFLYLSIYSANSDKFISLKPQDSAYRCTLCNIGFYGQNTLNAHKIGFLHQQNEKNILQFLEEIRTMPEKDFQLLESLIKNQEINPNL